MTTIHMKSSNKELHTDDLQVGQLPTITLNEDEAIDHEQIIIPVAGSLIKEQLSTLAFNEEPVTIRIERSSEKHAPKVVDAWVNGKGAEVLMNGSWVETFCLPVGLVVTTKRKYVEVMARSKTDNVTTKTGSTIEDSPLNIIDRNTSSRTPFSVIKDINPLGVQWLTNLLQEG